MITTKSTTVYVTTDGTEYIDKEDAEKGEFEHQLRYLLDYLGFLDGERSWNAGDLVAEMKGNRHLFQKVFNGEI